jgi:hypothetical protein
MQADDLGTRLLFKVTHHGVPYHFVEFFQRLGDGENRLTKGLRNVAPPGGSFTMNMISFILDPEKACRRTRGAPAVD